MKTANLAIVFTDIKGFTERTSRQTLEQNQKLLATHDGILGPIFKAFGGRVVKKIGDAFLVVFDSPTQAVLAGVAVQDKLWQYNRTVSGDDLLNVRVAINVGEVRLEDGDVFGEPVNIAARVEGIAEAGEVTFTEAVHLSMNKAEVPAALLGEFELKGIPGKVRCYTVPHAPYAVSPTGGFTPPATTPVLAAGEQPPFGNIGLAKLPELAGLAEFTNNAMSKSVDLARQAVGASKGANFKLLGGAVAALLLMGLLFSVIFGSGHEGLIREVEKAPATDQAAAVSAAQAEFNKISDEPKKQYWFGRLLEAQKKSEAASRYGWAAAKDFGEAKARLVQLVEHESCPMREAAVRELGRLKLDAGREAIEKLAKNGGPGDGRKLAFVGCNSQGVAQDVLEGWPEK